MHFFLAILYYAINCSMSNHSKTKCKTSLSRLFCSLRSDFEKVIYHASKFFLVLVFFGISEMLVHV